jgi:DNA-binding MarR family transcriptional regulator
MLDALEKVVDFLCESKGYHTIQEISRYTGMSSENVKKAVEILLKCDFVQQRRGKVKIRKWIINLAGTSQT